MPLHDWTDDRGWDSVHQLWINSFLFWCRNACRPATRPIWLGPRLSIAAEPGRPNLGVRTWQPRGEETTAPSETPIEAPA